MRVVRAEKANKKPLNDATIDNALEFTPNKTRQVHIRRIEISARLRERVRQDSAQCVVLGTARSIQTLATTQEQRPVDADNDVRVFVDGAVVKMDDGSSINLRESGAQDLSRCEEKKTSRRSK